MTHTEYLMQAATLRRIRKDGRISSATFAKRMTDLLESYSQTTDDDWETHVRSALAVAH